eukprot:scaffold29975_cov49-Phaeocystis_antarctica.AAC.3
MLRGEEDRSSSRLTQPQAEERRNTGVDISLASRTCFGSPSRVCCLACHEPLSMCAITAASCRLPSARLILSSQPRRKITYGGCRRGTQSSGDQLGRADAGSWQIADRYTMAS